MPVQAFNSQEGHSGSYSPHDGEGGGAALPTRARVDDARYEECMYVCMHVCMYGKESCSSCIGDSLTSVLSLLRFCSPSGKTLPATQDHRTFAELLFLNNQKLIVSKVGRRPGAMHACMGVLETLSASGCNSNTFIPLALTITLSLKFTPIWRVGPGRTRSRRR